VSSSDHSKELASLMKKLRASHPDAQPAFDVPSTLDPAEHVLALFVRSFLHWDAPAAKADAAMRKLEHALVDFNELRVCLPDELVAIIGERYPRAGERALRLRSALTALYSREHSVTLESVARHDHHQARSYLLSLEGTPEYVASRVCLVALSAHAAPIDHRILSRLVEAKVVDKNSSITDAQSRLESAVAQGEMPETYALLQAWADEGEFSVAGVDPPRVSVRPASPPEPAPDSRRRPPAPGKPSSKPARSGKPASKSPGHDGAPKKRTKAEK
jgi:endonuclease III